MTSRHITLSTRGGAVTEVEYIGSVAGSEEQYIIRYHKTPESSVSVVSMSGRSDRESWKGFRYHDEHWSFVRVDATRTAS